MRTRIIVSSLPLAVAALVSSCGGEGDPVERMLAALGGREAIDSLTSLAVSAECTGPSGPFRTEVKSLRPGNVYFRQTSERDTTIVWNTPVGTWLSRGEAIAPAATFLGSIARGHEFHLHLFEIEARFPSRERAGDEEIEGQACARFAMIDREQNAASLFVDERTDLPRMLELNPPGAAGAVRIYFDDWRRVGALLYFFSFRLTEGPERVFTYRYSAISPNTVDPGLFAELPAPDSSSNE